MESYAEQSKNIVYNIPKEGGKNTRNTESTISDETNSDKQVSSANHVFRKLSITAFNGEDSAKVSFKKKGGEKSGFNSVPETGESSGVKPKFQGKCKFCDIFGHKQADCFKFKNWLEKKKKGNPKVLPFSSVGRPVRCLKKKLLVLDVNGLLVDICPRQNKEPDTIIGRKALFKRPYYLEFLNFCFEKFEVGVWSSRIKKNVDSVIDYLMGNMKQRLLFCWDLSQCTETSFKTLENKHKPLVFKDLRKIWEKHDCNLPWEKGYYNESNTLLLDDSPYKALLNPPHNSIFPYTFSFQNQSDNSLGAGGDLRQYLDGLANAENMQEYIEQHPFGQKRISKTSQSWKFYLRVINSVSACEPKW